MNNHSQLFKENLTYWSKRSVSYSDVNKKELAGISRHNWASVLQQEICSHFPGRPACDIHVLDIGTGPGFFAILLAEAGFQVTAVDMTPEMLAEAGQNAAGLSEKIDFRLMNAESLDMPDNSYDVIVSRNLTWNLPHPETAYSEWHRVLQPGGLLLNFDSNWYSYLFDEAARDKYEEDRMNSARSGLGDQNVGENFDVMESIARRMPLSDISRPEWDLSVLSGLGFSAAADENIWEKVWTLQEQTNFSSTPLFMISATKQKKDEKEYAHPC